MYMSFLAIVYNPSNHIKDALKRYKKFIGKINIFNKNALVAFEQVYLQFLANGSQTNPKNKTLSLSYRSQVDALVDIEIKKVTNTY